MTATGGDEVEAAIPRGTGVPEAADAPVPVAPLPAARADDDWPVKAADGIVDLVDSVREVTTGRALTVATALVYGIVIAGAATAIGILGTILLFRLNERAYASLAEGLFDMPDPQPMWAVYLTWGLICVLVGLVLWRKRPRLEPPAADR